MDAASQFMAVNESHLFVFPNIDFQSQTVNQAFNTPLLKLPSFGNWWIWGMLATRMLTGVGGEMPSGTGISVNIYDAGLDRFWWTGGNLNTNGVLPLQLVAGKGGNPGVFAQPLFLKGGSNLIPLVSQTSGASPNGSSLLQIALIASLADSSEGNLPIIPSLGGDLAKTKGRHFKAIMAYDQATHQVPIGQTVQQVIALNKTSPFIMNAFTSDIGLTDSTAQDPLAIDDQILVNAFDTRNTWKMASPQDVNFNLMFGPNAARPAVPPSFNYMEADQNLAMTVTPVVTALNVPITPNFVFDGYLQEEVSTVPQR